MTSSSITVQWGPVDCIHRNGDITGYLVRYGKVQTDQEERTVVPGNDSEGMRTIPGLSAATTYKVEVAVETSVGAGPYSEIILAVTYGIFINFTKYIKKVLL